MRFSSFLSDFSKNKIVPIVLVILIVVVAILLYIISDKTDSVGTPQQQVYPGGTGTQSGTGTGATVAMSDNGFTPSTVQVRVGQSVAFVNQGSRPIWPASDPHPVHTQYPTQGGCVGSTFDACQSVAPGSSWSFQFTVAGTWQFHDHLNPSHKGVVVVQP